MPQAPAETTVVIFPDGTWDTGDNVKTAVIPDEIFDALISSKPVGEDGKANPALRAYMDAHGSYLSE